MSGDVSTTKSTLFDLGSGGGEGDRGGCATSDTEAVDGVNLWGDWRRSETVGMVRGDKKGSWDVDGFECA